MRQRWFGATGRRVPEVAVEGEDEIPLDEALVLDDVEDVARLREAHERGVPVVVRAEDEDAVARALARPEVACVLVPPARRDLRELDLRALKYGQPPVSTYSLVACDLERREWGVAVESKFLAVGSVVPWAEPEAGALATQAWANVRYGPEGLALLRDGLSAEETIRRLTEADERRDHRQAGAVDRDGRAATYTGSACLEWAGGTTGRGYAAQGNILAGEEVVAALARTFEETRGPLAERLLAALAAGREAGGDRRGQQSAALYVVRKGGGYEGWDVAVDLRVDDHSAPVAELERLYAMHDLLFGKTPKEEWVGVDARLAEELRERLARLGYAQERLEDAFAAWAGTENLEERVEGIDRVDPVVLEELRKRSA